MSAPKKKAPIGLSTADRLNAEIAVRRLKINECDAIKEQMEEEIAQLIATRSIVMAPTDQHQL